MIISPTYSDDQPPAEVEVITNLDPVCKNGERFVRLIRQCRPKYGKARHHIKTINSSSIRIYDR